MTSQRLNALTTSIFTTEFRLFFYTRHQTRLYNVYDACSQVLVKLTSNHNNHEGYIFALFKHILGRPLLYSIKKFAKRLLIYLYGNLLSATRIRAAIYYIVCSCNNLLTAHGHSALYVSMGKIRTNSERLFIYFSFVSKFSNFYRQRLLASAVLYEHRKPSDEK